MRIQSDPTVEIRLKGFRQLPIRIRPGLFGSDGILPGTQVERYGPYTDRIVSVYGTVYGTILLYPRLRGNTDRIVSVYGTVYGTVLLCPRLRVNTVQLRS